MAKVLVVDTNFSSGPILEFLRSLGHTVYCCGGNPQDYLAKNDPGYIQLDYSDAEALLALTRELHVDHLVPGCNDRSYLSCALVNAQQAFQGIDTLEATLALSNKATFRQLALREGLSTPALHTEDAVPAHDSVIVKPVDAFSGLGITVVRAGDAAGLQQAVQQAKAVSKTGNCVIETHVQGQLHSHSAFIQQGRVVQDFVVIEHGSANPFVVDTSHLAIDFPNTTLKQLRAEVEHMAQRLSLTDGLVHGQFLLTEQGFAWVEMTRRCPGDLYSQLIELSTAYPYAASYASPFVGLKAASMPGGDARWILRHTLTLPKGAVMAHLDFKRPLMVTRWVPLAVSGDAIAPSPKSRIAILFAQAASSSELLDLSQAAQQRQLYDIHPARPTCQ
ncbi:hypothetical protein NQT62_04720 [Limnobacter humi]|uniref:ATP-grasp domain-containing protein n=1 Tax=Limnobacter humi TaxID=1778671 RepID=A0ABT1WE20_9BURK|nr:hypothetical protein [Limnobacter humi]MCQ8895745.1 hypothetical protein [Limnobacter humi]